MKRSLLQTIILSGVAVLLAASVPVRAAQTIHVRIEGAIQGLIEGDSQVSSLNRQNTIEAYEYHHLMEIPTGGTAINHQTVILTKVIDRSTPKLLRAMDTNEVLTVQIRFFRPNMGGTAEIEYLRYTLGDARLVAIEPIQSRHDIPETAGLEMTERIRFSYGTITSTVYETFNEYTATVTP